MSEFLNKKVSSKALGLFRIAFGLLMIFQFSKIKKRIPLFEDKDYLFFPFPELDWLPVFSSSTMMLLWGLGILATILMIGGLFFRYATLFVALIYGYFFGLDAVYFNNHYYLIFLITLLLAFTNADRSYALRLKKKKISQSVPNWQYLILQLQLGIVFFYGGVSKCSADWFQGNIIKGITDSAFINNFLIFGGTIFDLLIPFALFFRKTRFIAIILVVLFNISNHFLFNDIASFPILVVACMLLFMIDGGMPNFISKFFSVQPNDKSSYQTSSIIKWGLISFFAFQFIYPLRHYIIPGHADWTGQGHYFAWRMKSYHKDIKVDLFAFDKSKNQRAYKINHGIDNYSLQRIASMPHMIPRLAEHVRKKVEKQDGINPNLGISVDYSVAFNQGEPKIAINPNFDVSRAQFSKYNANPWIIKLDN